jgi:DNA-binding transcriptional LysR family regulator
MEIRQIVYFLALCEELHFTRAARRCGVAQPSLTNGIRLLEREFGAPLFQRKPRPRLSQLGAAVRPELERALVHLDRALARAHRAPTAAPPRAADAHRARARGARGYAALTGVPPAATAASRSLRRSGPP